ncbi:hypothetical protein PPYR_15682 [Photinus pyralis]|uniref:Putative nuclease HARBI1 n=1 Tax=Photinus pyralis TaxID=7054 RepID=A0A5N4A093_PHOPY|nr:putative nuclease HARBI1 [Photinus pyralis]XP_031359298.1 putative nuclease HARBI1 [Photinus pyralis]KAB0790733.1 hypothetical protein PPYR_15682 [Photinus pyralis]
MDASSDSDQYEVMNSSSSSSSTDSDEELLLELNRRVRRERTFRERPDNFTKWSDQEFTMRFRLQKESVLFLLELIEGQLATISNRNKAITPMNQLLLTLRLYATGNMLIAVGDFSGVHKSTACRIVKKVTAAICTLSENYIRMPNTEEEIRNHQLAFYNIARFPRTIGAIDCTHVRIQSPGGHNAEYFRNRKGYFSLIVQVVGDASLRVLDIVVRWPGSTHDQTIFNNSRIHARLENGEFNNSIILGDSGYAIQKYLITPLLHPNNDAEQLFNEAQIRTRNPIERLFGVLKRRFPILSIGIRIKLQTAQQSIIACATLHNLARARNDGEPLVDPDVIVPVIDDQPQNHVEAENRNFYRQPFINYFSTL